jgi:hypothetical protein
LWSSYKKRALSGAAGIRQARLLVGTALRAALIRFLVGILRSQNLVVRMALRSAARSRAVKSFGSYMILRTQHRTRASQLLWSKIMRPRPELQI